MISKFDDYPIHQTPEPLAQTASSDRFTYDRYWYNGHAMDGSFYFGVSMGRYPNLGIMDCAFSIVVDGHQYAFHASRLAATEPSETVVGPFAIHILEPMGRHRLVIEANETGIECDLTFTPRSGVIQEGRQTLRNTRHIIMDATRFDQFGRWHGYIRYNGKELKVDGRTTLGLKDRSWGIRQVGEYYTGGAPIIPESVHFMWAPIHWENRCTLAGWFENGQGRQWHTDQAIIPAHDAVDSPVQLDDPDLQQWTGRIKHQFEFEPGTRRAQRARIEMNDLSGETLEISLEPLLLFRMKGIGYAHPEWGHGLWKGELAIGGESWKCDEADPLAWENLHIQQLVTARLGNETGWGILEQAHIGPYAPYQLQDWFDGA